MSLEAKIVVTCVVLAIIVPLAFVVIRQIRRGGFKKDGRRYPPPFLWPPSGPSI